ncbi:ABC transporter ATP-binding protein [Nitrospira sp. NS4]|uniref:ABC transporter ATP-binding protein n=1 Tax=Nitrospira sp. NS4 TaxID=3414498 RepID=UPI003C2B3F98
MAVDRLHGQPMTGMRRPAWLSNAIPELGIALMVQSLSHLRAFLRLRPLALGTTVLLGIGLLFVELIGIGVLVPLISLGTGETQAGVVSGVPVMGALERVLREFEPALRVLIIAGIVAVVGVVRSLLLFWKNYIHYWVLYRVTQDVHALCYRQFTHLPLACVSRVETGTHINLLVQFPKELGMVVMAVSTLSIGVLQLAVYLVVIVSISWKMGLVALAVLASALLLVSLLVMPRIEASGRVLNERSTAFHQWIIETIRGRSVLDGLGLSEFSGRRFGDRSEAFFSANAARERLKALVEPLIGGFALLMISAVLAVVALTPGDLATEVVQATLLVVCLTRLLSPLSMVSSALTTVRGYANSVAQVGAFLQEFSRAPGVGDAFPGFRQSVELRKVSLTYPGTSAAAVQEVSLSLRPNRMVALVGPSGAGKSSIVSLLLRFFEPNSGTIEADGIDIRRYSEDSWLRKVAFVPQESYLFNESIEENIRFGLDAIGHAEVLNAARLAHAHEFVLAQPSGYGTVVGDNGIRLSGGQKQRIAIARAVLRSPQLLILDEATSHLDSESEREIQGALRELRSRCALLVVAHRLSTVVDADEIVVMEQGHVVERGTHPELISRPGLYARLWALQAYHASEHVPADGLP